MSTRVSRWCALVVGLSAAAPTTFRAGPIVQTVQFKGATPEMLYDMFLNSKEHEAASGHGPVTVDPRVGGRLVAFALPPAACAAWRGCTPTANALVTATFLKLVPGREIVMAWKNLAWQQAVNPADVTELESIVTLTFTKNSDGAQIELVQVNVPDYPVKLPDSQGPLSALVNTHWNTVYWENWRPYVARKIAQK